MTILTELISVIILIHDVYTSGLDIYTDKGSTAILLCGIRKVGERNVRWSKKEGTTLTIGSKINDNLPDTLKNRLNVTGNHSIGEYNLQIADVQSVDSGGYACRVNFDVELIELFIKVKLIDVIINPSRQVEMENYEVQHFTCTAKSIPLAEIQWYLNSENMSYTSKTSTKDTVISTFEYVGGKHDSGKIVHCNATSDGTTVRSLSAILNITYGPGMSQTLNPSVTSLVKIKDEKLGPIICAAVCNPLCLYHWSKNGKVVENGYRLFKQSLEKTDTGNYRCRAWNGFGNSSIAFTLTVNYGPEYANMIPDNTFYTVRELSPLSIITCNTDCRPMCNKYWFGPNNQVIQSDTLNKSSIQRKEAGTYTCYGNNTVSSLKSNNITVIVTYGAAVISLETDNAYSTVNESQEVNMTCHVDGVPKPKIVWTLAGDVVRKQENKTNYLFTAHCEHTGNYTCSASNNLAEANQTKEMFVQCYPRIYTAKSTEQKVGLEDDEGLNITVTLIAYPAPHIQWFFQNYTISSNNSFGIFQHTTHLYKPKVDENDFGVYFLSTSNKLGNAEYHISVGGQRSPETANTHSSSPSFADGIGTGLGIAAIIFLITLVITAFIRIKRKGPPAPSNLYEETECKAGPANIYNELDKNKKDGQLELIKRRYNKDSSYMYEDSTAYENQKTRNEDPKGPIKDSLPNKIVGGMYMHTEI